MINRTVTMNPIRYLISAERNSTSGMKSTGDSFVVGHLSYKLINAIQTSATGIPVLRQMD